jgi:hypothetical protein
MAINNQHINGDKIWLYGDTFWLYGDQQSN